MHKSRLFKFIWLITGVSILCITALRLWLPNFVQRQLTERFEKMPNYTVEFSDVDLSIIHGSYIIEKIEVVDNSSKAPIPLFTAEAIAFTIPWSSIWDGEFFCSMDFYRPTLNFVRAPTADASQTNVDWEVVRLMKKLSPYPVDKFNVKDGKITFHDYHQLPQVELVMSEVELTGTNLRNSKNSEELLPGSVTGEGTIANGSVSFTAKLNPLQSKPLLDMETELRGIELRYFSDFLKSEHAVHVNQGVLSMSSKTHVEENKIVSTINKQVDDFQVKRWTKTPSNENPSEDTDGEEKKSKFMVASWNFSPQKTENSQVLQGEIENYKGNLISLTSEALLGIFVNVIVPDIEKSVPKPVRKEREPVIVKSDKKEKKNLFQKIFRKKVEEEKKRHEETVTASER